MDITHHHWQLLQPNQPSGKQQNRLSFFEAKHAKVGHILSFPHWSARIRPLHPSFVVQDTDRYITLPDPYDGDLAHDV